jgi:hypothetical protein
MARPVESMAGASILPVPSFRPGYLPVWLDKSYVTQIAEQPLGLDDGRHVVLRQ